MNTVITNCDPNLLYQLTLIKLAWTTVVLGIAGYASYKLFQKI